MANSVSRVTIALSAVATTNSKGHKTRKGGRGGGGGGRGRGKKDETKEDLVVDMAAPKAYLESNMIPAGGVMSTQSLPYSRHPLWRNALHNIFVCFSFFNKTFRKDRRIAWNICAWLGL